MLRHQMLAVALAAAIVGTTRADEVTDLGDVVVSASTSLLNRQYVTYFSQTTPSNDSYNAGRGRVVSLSWSRRF